VLICPVHQFIMQPGALQARARLASIGELVSMDARFQSAGADAKANADAVMIDILPHPLSLMQILLRDGLAGLTWQTLHPAPGELHAIAAQGSVALSIAISMSARPTLASFHATGTEGSIHLDLYHGYAFFEAGNVSRTRKILHPFEHSAGHFAAAALNLGGRVLRREPAYPGLRELFRAFYMAVQGQGPLPISRQDALLVAEMRDSLARDPQPESR
jgi:hypothetical protein